MPRVEGTAGNAVPDTRGVPVPTKPYRAPTRPVDPERSLWARRPSGDEFTREQLERAGYTTGGTTSARRVNRGRGPRRRPASFDVAGAVRDYVAGESSTIVAERYGVSAQVVLDAVRTAGHAVRPRGGRR